MIITIDEYIEQYIKPNKEDLTLLEIQMIKSTNCHKYHNEKVLYMKVEYLEDIELNSFTPLSQQAFDEIEVKE